MAATRLPPLTDFVLARATKKARVRKGWTLDPVRDVWVCLCGGWVARREPKEKGRKQQWSLWKVRNPPKLSSAVIDDPENAFYASLDALMNDVNSGFRTRAPHDRRRLPS